MALNISHELDVDYLNQVYGDDATIIHMIFDAFVTDSYPRWIDLKKVLDDMNLKDAAAIVHGIKPSFTMTGITWLKPRVEAMEHAIKAGESNEKLLEFYNEIKNEVDRLIPILQSEAARLGGM